MSGLFLICDDIDGPTFLPWGSRPGSSYKNIAIDRERGHQKQPSAAIFLPVCLGWYEGISFPPPPCPAGRLQAAKKCHKSFYGGGEMGSPPSRHPLYIDPFFAQIAAGNACGKPTKSNVEPCCSAAGQLFLFFSLAI